jgi:recombinational DNA repair ATPase RecF
MVDSEVLAKKRKFLEELEEKEKQHQERLRIIEESTRTTDALAALESLRSEGWDEALVKQFENRLAKLEETQDKWRSDQTKAIEYIYGKFRSELVKACEKEIDRILEERFAELQKIDDEICESLIEMHRILASKKVKA